MLSCRRPSSLLALGLLAASPCLAGASTTLIFPLEGKQEVPPVASPANGGCIAVVDAGASQLSITCSHDVATPELVHIHKGAFGANGPVVFDLGDPTSPISAVWTGMSTGDVADALAGDLYVNLHSSGRPSGEIRGQIKELAPDDYTFPMDGSQQVPPDTNTTATGLCSAQLSADRTMLDVTCVHDVSNATAAHIHFAPAGMNGPVELLFADPVNPSGTLATGALDVARFVAGFFYVNIHSPNGSGEGGGGDPGEIRGQIRSLPIFTDGFESGDTVSWSASVP